MKNLRDQIEFIDKKLIVLFGFKGITDYTHSINITDVETIKLDLIKLNELIIEFRKTFHAKNFNLHKSDYKIQTEVQAVCLLKTCLEVTSIPFDVSLKKNKRIMRLITKNNVLEDYINTLKMSENGSLKQNPNLILKPDSPNPNAEIKPWIPGQQIGENVFFLGSSQSSSQPSSNTIVSPWYSSTIEPDEIKSTSNNDNPIYSLKTDIPPLHPSTIVKPWIPEDTGIKQPEKFDTITKEMLNESIKSTEEYSFSTHINKKFMFKMRNINNPMIVINLKHYDLHDKNIKGCTVSIKSKELEGKPILSQEFINNIISDITYELFIKAPIYEDKFVNGQNIIVSNIILFIKHLMYDNVEIRLHNIDKIINYLDMLEIEFNISHVKFYAVTENKLLSKNKIIQQEIEHNGLFNKLNIISGMAGLLYSKYLTKQEYLNNENGYIKISKQRYLDDEIEKSGAKIYKGSNEYFGVPSFLTGLELVEYDDNLFKSVENGYITGKYDFVTWKKSIDIPVDSLPYYKINQSNCYLHCFNINITGKHDTINEILIEIPDFTFSSISIGKNNTGNYSDSDIQLEYIDIFTQDAIKGPINSFRQTVLCRDRFTKIDLLENIKHTLTYGGVGSLRLLIKSSSSENPIQGKNIKFTGRFYSWNNTHLYLLQKLFMKTRDFINLNILKTEK